MDKKRVISRKNLPTRLPLWETLITYILLDFYNASDVLCGVIWTLWVIVWIICLIGFWNEEYEEVI